MFAMALPSGRLAFRRGRRRVGGFRFKLFFPA